MTCSCQDELLIYSVHILDYIKYIITFLGPFHLLLSPPFSLGEILHILGIPEPINIYKFQSFIINT